MMGVRRWLPLGLLMLAASCTSKPEQTVAPALWELRGAGGERAWLFGTVHALPERVIWRSAAMDSALRQSDRLVLEITNADDPQTINAIYEGLAASRGLLPLESRVPPGARAQLRSLMEKLRLDPDDFGETETWAAALSISRQEQGEAQGQFGMEQELMAALKGKPLAELEGAEAQLRLFDSLPEKEQQDLLLGVLAEAANPDEGRKLAEAWMTGDMQQLARETRTGLLGDPELRLALLDSRNRAWAEKIVAMIASGQQPLVAVGAAHMAGAQGLPALLARKGYTVQRVQ